MSRIWGFLRETEDKAIQSGVESTTGLCRTGLDTYLSFIYPTIDDWVHDKIVDTLPKDLKCRRRPDYRSETLKLIVEFDGLPHYSSPLKILDDYKATKLYMTYGYKVIRIPYFIQLTTDVVNVLFNVKLKDKLFDPTIASFTDFTGVPANLCQTGVNRMAYEFQKFPQQYKVNLAALYALGDDFLTGARLLENTYLEYMLGITEHYLPRNLI